MRKKRICYACGWGGYFPDDMTVQYCAFCDRKMPGTALILHPNPMVRDPYGVLTVESLRMVCRYVETWKAGWDDAIFLNKQTCTEVLTYAGYWEVLDFMHGLVDLPLTYKQQIALFVTREKRDLLETFNPVL